MCVPVIYIQDKFPSFLCVFFKLTADMLEQVTTVQLGEPVTLTCVLPPGDLSSKIHWYKQRAGETLKLIATLRQTAHPQYGQGFNASRLEAKDNKNISSLTIFRTIPEDEGMYHCAVMEWNVNAWSGTYLLLKGNYVIAAFWIHCKYSTI